MRRAFVGIGLAMMLCGQATAVDFVELAADPSGGRDAAIAPDGSAFVTSSYRAGSWDLWRYDIAEGSWTQLTDDPEDEIEPRWSPDGRRLTYVRRKDGNLDVWVLDLDSGARQEIAASPGLDDYPSFSPDGRRIVYTTGGGRERHVAIIDADGSSRPDIVTRTPGYVGACVFQPDATALVCHGYEPPYEDVFRLHLADGRAERLTRNDGRDYKAAVSPDGRTIAFTRRMAGRDGIRVMPADGSAPARPLTDTIAEDRWPMFAGDRLFFHRVEDGGADLRVLDTQTGDVSILAFETEQPGQGAFSPDGRQVVYCAVIDDRRVIRVVERDTLRRRTLPLPPGSEGCFPRWSPDGKRIGFLLLRDDRWVPASAQPDGSDLQAAVTMEGWTVAAGPIDWHGDGRRLMVTAKAGRHAESDIVAIQPAADTVERLTDTPTAEFSPAWSDQGLLFASKRAGPGALGIYRQGHGGAAATIEELAVQRRFALNYPRPGPAGQVLWSQYDSCDGVEYIAIGSPADDDARAGDTTAPADAGLHTHLDATVLPVPDRGSDAASGSGAVGTAAPAAADRRGTRIALLHALPGVRWPTTSPDGREILFTRMARTVRFLIGPVPAASQQ